MLVTLAGKRRSMSSNKLDPHLPLKKYIASILEAGKMKMEATLLGIQMQPFTRLY